MPTTIGALPHEIVLRIVEWTDKISRIERERRLLAEEEAAHAAVHGHAHPPHEHDEEGDGDGDGIAGLAGLQPQLTGPNGAGIPGLANLFGLFGGAGPGGNNAAGPAAAPAPPANGPPNANAVPPGNAGGGFFDGLWQAMGAAPGAGPPADVDDATDDEMPALEPLQAPTPAAAPAQSGPTSSTSGTATVSQDSDDEEQDIPPLEAFGSGSAAVLEPVAAAPVNPSGAPDIADQTPMAEVQNPLESPSASQETAMDESETQADLQTEGQENTPATATSEQFAPFEPATPSVSGSLAQEVLDNTADLTAQDMADVPDLTSPTTANNQPGIEEGLPPLQEGDSDEWEDAESSEEEPEADDEDMEPDADEDEEEDIDGENDEDVEDDDEDDDDDTDMPELETSPNYVDPATFTYKDGLPEDPLLPLAFVNRSFLNAVRTILYGRALTIVDMYQASLLLETLKSPTVSVADIEPEADDDEQRKRAELAYLVRQLIFDVRKTISLGRGGGNLILEILDLCPRIETLVLTMDWTRTALDPLSKELKKVQNLKSISLRSGLPEKKELVWDMRNLDPLLASWTELEDLQISWLKTAEGPFSPLGGRITKLSLNHVDIRDGDLAHLLSKSKDVLKVLEIHLPSDLMTRKGIAEALKEYGAKLESLQIDVSRTWHQRHATAAVASTGSLTVEQAAGTRYLLDGLIGYLPKLKELKLSGSLASTVLVARLPKSILTLALEDNLGVDIRKLIGLFKKTRKVKGADGKTKTVPTVLPKLKCFTYARSDGMRPGNPEQRQMVQLMRQRKACMHWMYNGRDGPAAVWAAGVGPGDGPWEGMPMALPFPMPVGPDGGFPPMPAGMMNLFAEDMFPPIPAPGLAPGQWFE